MDKSIHQAGPRVFGKDAFIQTIKLAVEARLDADVIERIASLRGALGGREVDDFGFDPDALKLVLPPCAWIYRNYFRVETFDMRDLPPGRVLFIANHSGQIPIDAAMIGIALLLEAHPPRAVRSMVERWVPTLPYISTLFARLGQITGTPENCRLLLRKEHAVLVFPEGVRGITKTYDRAYQLQDFGYGFMRLALETGTPIVPVGVVGAEEQAPAIWNLESIGKLFGVPSLPITPTPFLGLLPYPSKYRIYFGRPMYFTGDPDEDEAALGDKVQRVKSQVDLLLKRGLAEREHVFW